MIADPGQTPLNPPEAGEFPASGETKLPKNWLEAISCLISSRIALIQAESKEAAGTALGKIILLAVAAFFIVLFWLLVVAGLIGAIAEASSWKWYHVSFAAAGVHALVAAIILLVSRSRSARPSFPITRSEFEKDREWLNQIKNQSSSGN